MTIKNWFQAARLRTLPLALGCMVLATAISTTGSTTPAPSVIALLFLTTILLQILSNFANDYGDGVSGVDNDDRQGPERVLASGKVSASSLKIAVIISAIAAFTSGVLLLIAAPITLMQIAAFFAVGILAIIAAITYTVGKRPYGYVGLGDLSVFIFFGPVAVLGGSFLLTASWQPEWILASVTAGALATAVLNINNIRDIETDLAAGKQSIAARLGRPKAFYYHLILVGIALISGLTFMFMQLGSWMFFSMLMLPLFALHAIKLRAITVLTDYNAMLKFMVILSFVWELVMSLELLLAA